VKHYNITVLGRVQGVGFRYSAMEMARAYAIRGFIRNEVDGSVYLEVEGESENLALFLEWCRKGSEFGRVDRIIKNESGLRGFSDFTISH